jgi:hypothetical protein
MHVKTCERCPTPLETLNGRRRYCRSCKAIRDNEAKMEKRALRREQYWAEKAARKVSDYPPHIIELKYIRAIWATNPAKAQRLLRARQEAA